ncbi:MAG: Na/Pi cotransporter family protein [Brumimicrobium sp.]|nr:Na/Pi cotransporter family protein [Brumimicrobium sp.]
MYNFLMVLGALILFVYSLKTLSEGIQQAFGNQLRNLMGAARGSRLRGILAGLGISASVQSSSITTVMVISYVNSGLMSMAQSASVIMGANIGTTITAWLIFLFGFYFEVGLSSIVLVAIASPFVFLNSGKMKSLASVLIGATLILVSIHLMRVEIESLGFTYIEAILPEIYDSFSFLIILFFALLGALLTVIVQSSAATIALIMTFVSALIIPMDLAVAMVIGSNVGTTITGELASYRASLEAKRAARLHALFNIIGAFWVIIFYPFIYPLFEDLVSFISSNEENILISSLLGVALFHTLFNAVNTLLQVWFIPQLIKVTEKSVVSESFKNKSLHLTFIGKGVMSSADLSLLEVKNEIARFAEITSKMSGFTRQLLYEKNAKKSDELHQKIAKYEDITDNVEIEVANYLTKISENKQSESSAIRIRSMNSIVNDLESIGDVFYRMSKMLKRKDEEKIWFTPEQRTNLNKMFKIVDEAFEIMIANLNREYDQVNIQSARETENKLNDKRDQLRKEYIESITSSNDGNLRGGMIYSDIFESIEKVGDHIINVSEAIVGEI